MVIEKRKRNQHMGYSINKSEKKIKYNFDINVLALFGSYVLSENKNIKRGHLVNLRNLMSLIDMDVYQADPERKKLIEFINRGLEARINQDLKDKRLILSYINGGIIDVNMEEELNKFSELSDKELQYVNSTITGALDSMIAEENMEMFYGLFTKYKAQDYRYRADMMGEIKTFVSSLHNQFRQVDSRNANGAMFSLDPRVMEQNVSDVYDKITSPNRFLQTQMQGFNQMLGGGLESSRFYLLLGSSGVGKSLTMLNIALQIKRKMKGLKAKDPTKKPTILFLTQENSMEETVERLFTIISGHKMINFTKEEVYNILLTDGELTLTEENNINIHILYKPDRSIDTSDLYTIIEELEDDGYEVIALFQDHIKRIRSVEGYTDVRLELGAVVNELKTVGIIKDIPVMSVSHLNRDANKVIDENVGGNKFDLTRLLGRSNVGESLLMIDNSDAVIIIGEEWDSEKNKYVGMNLIKLRYAPETIKFMCYPYDTHNNLRILTDDHLQVPIYKETLRPDTALNNMVNGSVMKRSSYTSINMLEEENIFSELSDSGSGETFTNDSIESLEEDLTGPCPVNIQIGSMECPVDDNIIQLISRVSA